MARIWMSGFEAAHIDIFAAPEGAISAAQQRTGAYSFYIADDTKGGAQANFPAAVAEIYCRFGIWPGSDGGRAIVLKDNVGTAQAMIYLNPEALTIEACRGTTTVLGRGGVWHVGRWQCIEFRLLVDDATGVFQVKLNGTQVINFSGDTQQTANANVASFTIGTYGNVAEGYYDDIAFNDVAGGINDSWIGRGGIPAIFPTGAGNSTDLGLFPNTGEANWEDVDEVPPDDDTTYVFDAVIDEHDSYAASNLVAAGTISAVQWLARARSDLVGNPEIARILRIGGVDYQGGDIAIDADYDYYIKIFDQDPNAGPGAWTVAAINGMELGVKVR